MPLFRKIFNFYLHSSIHVGLAVFCLVRLSAPELSSYSVLVFFGTILGYNFLKHSQRLLSNQHLDQHSVAIISLSALSAAAFGFFFAKQNSPTQLHLLLALVFVLIYPLLRKVGWLKPFFVSFVVSYITVLIPLKDHHELPFLLLQRFLLLSSLMIPFEISDAATDSISLQTLPQFLGIKHTKQLGYTAIALFLFVAFYTKNKLDFSICCALSSFGAIYFSSPKRNPYYTSFWVESIPIAWWLLFWFL